MSDWTMNDLYAPAYDPMPIQDFGASTAGLYGGFDAPNFSMPSYAPTTDWSSIGGTSFGGDYAMPQYTDYGYQSYASSNPQDFASYLSPFGDGYGAATSDAQPWYEKLGDWALANPDKAVGAGLGVLNGIGGAMSAIQCQCQFKILALLQLVCMVALTHQIFQCQVMRLQLIGLVLAVQVLAVITLCLSILIMATNHMPLITHKTLHLI